MCLLKGESAVGPTHISDSLLRRCLSAVSVRSFVGDKYATGVSKIKKIRGRENIAVGAWNVRTLRPAGKLEQLTHTMSRYHWNIVGLCEMRWKNFGEMSTDDGHKVYFSGEEGKHEYGVGFLVHKDVVGAILGCQPVSSRLISFPLRAAPFNITIIQVYAPTSGHDGSEVDHFYQKLQETIDQTPKKDILVVQGDWNAKVGKDAQADWGEVCGPYCNVETNERSQTSRVCNLQQPSTDKHPWPSQTIQKMDMAQPRWETPQSD